jgi:hypothetical protein
LFVVFNKLFISGFLAADIRMDGNTFDDRPTEASRYKRFLVLLNFINGPNLPIGDMVKGRYDTGRTGLFNIGQGNRIVGAEPSPGLLEFPRCRGSFQIIFN